VPEKTRHRRTRKPAPKHAGGRVRRSLRRPLLLAAAATVATAGVVSAGVAASAAFGGSPVQAALSNAASGSIGGSGVLKQMKAERGTARRLSRSADRPAVDMTKVKILHARNRSGGQVTHTKDLGSGDPKAIAQAMLPQFGWSSSEFSCLDALWTKESGWDPHAENASSGAYGIPQALPGSKMATAGSDWATNPATQIKWGLGYIRGSYGSPCGAWSHSEAYGWY
jgi:hypothetical protein